MVGNLPNFNRIDVLRCLLSIEKPASRSYLSKELELGEGTIRSILDILKEKGFLISNKEGHSLSQKGKNAVENLKKNIILKKIKNIPLFPDKKAAAIQVKNPKKMEKSVILRDESVRNGAEGALILKYWDKLEFYDLNHDEDLSEIEKEFELKKNDIVIAAYSSSYKLAEHGAIAAAVLIEDNLRNFLNKF